MVGTALTGRGTESACKRLRRRPAKPIRDSKLSLQAKSECTGGRQPRRTSAITHYVARRSHPASTAGLSHAGGEPAASALGLQRTVGDTGMNLQQDRIEALCAGLKLGRIAAEWPAAAMDSDHSGHIKTDFPDELTVAPFGKHSAINPPEYLLPFSLHQLPYPHTYSYA